MKKTFAAILFTVFLSFIVGPTVVALIDDSVDISFAFTANEEENSSKNLVSFEYTNQENSTNYRGIMLLSEQRNNAYSYYANYHQVFLDVLSPPPKNI